MVLPLRDDNPTKRRAIVTFALIAINIVIYFAIQPHTGSDAEQNYLYKYAAIPCEVTTGHPESLAELATSDCHANENTLVRTQEGVFRGSTELYPHKNVYLAIFYSMFLHGSIAHVLGNMLFLWIFGNNVEDRLGPYFYLLFYLVMGGIAALTFILLNTNSVDPIIGASGAIAGVMGAYLIWFPRARVLTLVGFFPLYLPAVVVLGLWFLLQFVTNPNEGVAWQAHVGGFVAGAAVALALRPFFGGQQPRRAPAGPWDDYGGGFRGGYPGRT